MIDFFLIEKYACLLSYKIKIKQIEGHNKINLFSIGGFTKLSNQLQLCQDECLQKLSYNRLNQNNKKKTYLLHFICTSFR